MKLYIAVKDEVPDHMVPVLVAHTIMNADHFFSENETLKELYLCWKKNSFKKCVVRLNEKEWMKFTSTDKHIYYGYESTVLNAENSCGVFLSINREELPNVLKFAKLWSPKC